MKIRLTKFSALEPIIESEVSHWQALFQLGLGNYIDLILFDFAINEIDDWSYIYAERIKD